jgi:hypothetical protein
LLRSLQEIQPDFEEEAKAYAGLWSQGKKKDHAMKTYWEVEVQLHSFFVLGTRWR